METWRSLLKGSRQALKLSRRQLAEQARVSPATIKAYELGPRHPKRPYLVALLDALKLDRATRSQILSSAGLAPDGLGLRPDIASSLFTPDEAAREIERCAWPVFVTDEMGQVVAANSTAQRLWGVDLRSELLDPIDRHLLSVASNPRFADRCVNWDDVACVIAAGWRDHHRGAEQLENPSTYLSAVLERFLSGDPKYVTRFFDLWQRAAPMSTKVRLTYPIVWDQPGVGVLHFTCLAHSANDVDGYDFHDWIPSDAASWETLEKLTNESVTRAP